MKNIWFFILSFFSFRCSICGGKMKRNGNTKDGNELWICKKCKKSVIIEG